jgi:CheY-like chemotaxis protein/anti-sigma regulatory factor (Ser/Thr protein kinase)
VQAGIATAKAAGHGADHVFALRCRRAIVCADRTRVEQIIANLIGNAIKYSPRGSKIVVETRVDGDEAVLSVADSGMGLTAEQMRSVFELFYQAPRGDNRVGGLGIGLTVVKRIVELHGGSVVVGSAGQGRGATFTVRLPLLKDRAAVVEAPPVCREPGRGMNVVLVEDNRDARESLGMLLTADGHAVYTAVDGIQGLNQILDIEPDAAIVDIDLPGMDGYEIARRVRAAGHGGMLLIAHSGYGQAEDVLRAHEAGFDDHLVKPVDMQKLRRLLASGGGRRPAAGEPTGVTRLFAIKPLAPSGGRPLAS